MKIVAIIQARMSSTRLPGKALADVCGQPMLYWLVKRVQQARRLEIVAVATSDQPEDDVIEEFCRAHHLPCVRGSRDDVLDRFYQAAEHFQADVIVRLTADCPLLDTKVIDLVVEKFLQGQFDYVSNTLERTYPDGLDTEVFSRETLARTWREARLPSEREHVTPYIYKHPELFRLGNLRQEQDLSHLRWTVDQPRDLELIRQIYNYLQGEPGFGMGEVLALWRQHPELSAINAGIKHNEGYQKSLREDEARMKRAGPALYARAKKRIPGGTQLLSKRPEMILPEHWPSYYSRAQGVEVWDLDGNKYIDMSYNGLGACILGAADPEVDQAVRAAIQAGSMSTLNAPEEVELADLLCELHPWAAMVRYARTGGEAMAMAVRIARAATGRDKIAFCGYHGWHDWYLSANLAADHALDGHLLPGLKPAGVPRGLQGTALPFRYNHIEELESIIAKQRTELAAIIMEPIREHEPKDGFLQKVRSLAAQIGAALIFDEITAGWRLNTGGVHLMFGIEPDMAVFAKGMSNGYAMAAVIGREAVMQKSQDSFISSTYWTERIGPAAALATIRKHRRCEVAKHLICTGQLVQAGWKAAAEKARLPLEIGGIPPLSHFSFAIEEKQAARTLFTQLLLERGFLASNAFYATFAHQEEHVRNYLEAVTQAFAIIAEALDKGNLVSQLHGPVAHTGFRRLT